MRRSGVRIPLGPQMDHPGKTAESLMGFGRSSFTLSSRCVILMGNGSRSAHLIGAAGVGVRRLARRPIGSAAGLVVGDVRDTDAVAEAVSGVSTVVHCAAYVG